MMPTGITGTVQAPISSSTSKGQRRLSRFHGKSVTVAETVATNLDCALYSLEGTLLGQAATDASGSVSISVARALLGDTARVALHCTDTAGRVALESAAIASVTSATTTVALGTVDAVSTQATLGLRGVLACDWTATTCSVPSTIDLACAFAAERAAFRTASLDATNTSQRLALLQLVGPILTSAAFDPATAGMSDMTALLTALHDADGLSAEALNQIASVVASALGSDTATIAAALANADDTAAALDRVVGDVLAAGIGQRALANSASLCSRASDASLMALTLDPLLSASSSSALATTYGRDGAWGVIIDTVDALATASDASTLSGRLDLLDAYLAPFAGDYASLYDSSAANVDDNTIVGLLGILADIDATATSDAQRDFVEGWQQLIVADQGWADFISSGALDTELADYISAHFAESGFDPATFDFENFVYNLEGIDLSAADTCEEIDDYEQKIACYEALYGDFTADDDTVTFRVTTVSPTAGSSVAVVDPFRVTATFNNAVDTTTLSFTSFQVLALDATGATLHAVTGNVSYDDVSQTLMFTPAIVEDFVSGSTYRALLDASISDTNAATLGDSYQWEFTVQ